jgi:hypothetical protein
MIALGEACTAAPSCAPGMEATTASAGHCCWAAQTWDATRQTCAGAPASCPSTHFASGESCVALATCVDGRVSSAASAGQCCWPGQTWGGAACVGTPSSCPAGFVVHGSECVPGVERAFAEVQRLTHGLRYRIPADGITGMYLLQSGPGCELVVQQTIESGTGADFMQVISHEDIAMARVTAVEVSRNVNGEAVNALGPAWSESSVEPGRRSWPRVGFIASGAEAVSIARAVHDLAIACGASATLSL